MADDLQHEMLLEHTTSIITAYLSNNQIESSQLPVMIEKVYTQLVSLSNNAAAAQEVVQAPKQKPAVSIKESIKNDYIVCLEDGKKLKMLKRYLKTNFDMTPAQYREKWGLPDSYPMVAPDYALKRSKLAKSIGLGTKSTVRRGRRKAS